MATPPAALVSGPAGLKCAALAAWRPKERRVTQFRNPWSRRADPPPPDVHAEPVGFARTRFIAGEVDDGPLWLFGGPTRQAAGVQGASLKVLVLSGGGAGGAFGAGALVGLSQAAARPTFDVVTGVSTGAFIAPFAFLGADWDARLAQAYCDGAASKLLSLSALRPGVSLFGGETLDALVEGFIDRPLVDAVAQAYGEGRRLFVATANLDTETTSIWDMGAIAQRGGPAALALFRDILVASASLPGLFPPKMIPVESHGRRYEEMHVDGGAISPLFVVPEPSRPTRAPQHPGARAEIYVLVNTTLEAAGTTTAMSVVPILMRSFELILKASYRNALRSVADFCQINGFVLRTAAAPSAFAGISMLRFEAPSMTEMFKAGARLAADGALWRESGLAGTLDDAAVRAPRQAGPTGSNRQSVATA